MKKRATGRLLDREELPFTEREIRQAAALLWPKAVARKIAAHLATIAPGYVRHRGRRRARLRAHGIHDNGPLHGWVLPEELLPLLTLVSPDAAKRVKALRHAGQEDVRRGLIYHARVADGRRRGTYPTEQEAMDQARAYARALGDEMEAYRGMAISVRGRLPRPNKSHRAVADAEIARQERKWQAFCRDVERRVSEHRKRAV